jgi:histidine ammonia-lyase
MIALNPGKVSLSILRDLWAGAPARLSGDALSAIDSAAASVGRIVAGGKTVYGINTGFGLLAQTRIPADKLADLQRNLILSHSCGLGEALPRHVTRLMIILKLIGLGRGHSGVRRVVIDALQSLLDADAMPIIPSQGALAHRAILPLSRTWSRP